MITHIRDMQGGWHHTIYEYTVHALTKKTTPHSARSRRAGRGGESCGVVLLVLQIPGIMMMHIHFIVGRWGAARNYQWQHGRFIEIHIYNAYAMQIPHRGCEPQVWQEGVQVQGMLCTCHHPRHPPRRPRPHQL